MTRTFPKVGALLDREDYEWLLGENEELVTVIEQEVIGGAEPEAIGRYVANRIGEHRVGRINRCIGAARHIASVQAR